jgi:multimeric flavodoxin WrbA
MKVTLINGNPENGSSHFEAYVKDLTSTLKLKGIQTVCFNLRENNVLSCTGCWGCWVKTPGECLFEDDTVDIRRQVIHSDWVIFLSPLVLGFTSALLKKVQDKFIPLVHPYIELVNNECHHIKRYEKYPKIGLLYAPETDTDDEDLAIISDIYRRFALNFKSELSLFRSIEEPIENLVHEIDHH